MKYIFSLRLRMYNMLFLSCHVHPSNKWIFQQIFFQIYFASEEYGLDSTVTCRGYFLMADVFAKQGKMPIARSLYSEVKYNRCDVIMTWQYDQIYFSLYRPWLILCCSYCRWLVLGTAIWPNSSRLTFKMSRILTCCWSPLMVRPFTLNMHHIKTPIKQYKTSQLGFIQLSNSTMLFKQGA